MSILKTIKELYPEVNFNYLPQNPSVSINHSLEAEIQKGRSSEGLQRVKNLVEAEHN